jgi:hypothetical protein
MNFYLFMGSSHRLSRLLLSSKLGFLQSILLGTYGKSENYHSWRLLKQHDFKDFLLRERTPKSYV